VDSVQLFNNGNNHIINFGKMLNFLNANNSLFNEEFENIDDHNGLRSKSFREHYAQKLEHKNKLVDNINKDAKESDYITTPDFQHYWNQTLN
jgi:hypothetical protein